MSFLLLLIAILLTAAGVFLLRRFWASGGIGVFRPGDCGGNVSRIGAAAFERALTVPQEKEPAQGTLALLKSCVI